MTEKHEMNNLKKTNTGRAQICHDDKFGLVIRQHSSKYFYEVTTEQAVNIMKNVGHYVSLPDNSVPRSMIRKNYRNADNEIGYCIGCGKRFRKIEMDGGLCRGFDGCSVNAEIKSLRKQRGLCESRSFL